MFFCLFVCYCSNFFTCYFFCLFVMIYFVLFCFILGGLFLFVLFELKERKIQKRQNKNDGRINIKKVDWVVYVTLLLLWAYSVNVILFCLFYFSLFCFISCLISCFMFHVCDNLSMFFVVVCQCHFNATIVRQFFHAYFKYNLFKLS